MAKSSRSKHRTRVSHQNTNHRLRYNPTISTSPSMASWAASRPNLRLFEDRRTWHPQKSIRPARAFVGPSVIVGAQPRHSAKHKTRLQQSVKFKQPFNILVCVRRHIRKEIMHAFGLAGRGGQRKPVRNWLSGIHCS